MNWHKSIIEIQTKGKGLYPFTDAVQEQIHQFGIRDGVCYLFIQHTSASLVVSESYDPTARIDLESFFDKLVPENQPWHLHTLEGIDDSPSHMRAMLTNVSLTIPIDHGQLSLGAWQGIYVFEHRSKGHNRKVLLRCLQANELLK
jgi:secondary thiamine-phosphate synthase enzyme